MSHLLQPTIVLLKEGSESSQGKGHVIHNMTACQAVGDILKTTLGPRGMDKLVYKDAERVTISNDGRTIIDLLDIVHPAAKTLVDIARAQDDQVGDGTTTVIILATELMKQAKTFVEDGVHPQLIVRAYRRACETILNKLNDLAVDYQDDGELSFRTVLIRCAATSLNSKLISTHKTMFAEMAVEAVLSLDPEELDLKMVGIAKVSGGDVTASQLVKGVAFKKTFSYAGFEQQPKSFQNPIIVLLNVELELKAEKENAEIRISDPDEYQSIVDAEWRIIYEKLESIVDCGAKVVLSRLPIGDLGTQYFADRDIFCAGRVPQADMKRVSAATGGAVQTSLADLNEGVLGTCGLFEEKQVGSDRYNFFTGNLNAQTATIILRGGAEQFIEETHRSLWDALNVVKRCIQNHTVVGGGGAIEMELSRFLRTYARSSVGDKSQMMMSAFAKALEIIPRQLATNGGYDATDIVNQLRYRHANGDRWMGVELETGGVTDTMQSFVWEPALNKRSAIGAATEACCTILQIDETIKNAKAQDAGAANNKPVPVPGARPTGRPSIR